MNFQESDADNQDNLDLTIIINSCDAYVDVLNLFFRALSEYWPNNRYPIIINTESSILLNYNDDEKQSKQWGERLLDVLSNVDTNYVLMMFDDFILEGKVDQKKINAALNVLINDSNSAVFYLNAACVKDHDDDPLSDYRLLKDGVEYRLNSVPAIWNRTELIKYTGVMDNPWSWEVFGSYRTYDTNKNFYSASSQQKNIIKYNYLKGGAIYRGKWVKEVVEEKIEKYRLDIDLQKRGCVDLNEKVNRSLLWKIQFIILGYKSIGFKVFHLIARVMLKKIKK